MKDETDNKTLDAFERWKEGLEDEADIPYSESAHKAELPSPHPEPRRKCWNGCNNCNRTRDAL